MECCILNIGYEILQGRVINTNGAYLARRLTILGHEVKVILSVGDNIEDLYKALKLCLDTFDCDLIITTGGLGPTPDDITLEAIARYFSLPLETHPQALREIEEKYKSKGMELTEERIKMARMPRGAIPLRNPVGIAPGMMLRIIHNNRERLVISLPGVPKEMEAMFTLHIEPLLRGSKRLIEAEILVTPGIESEIAPVIEQMIRLHPNVYIKSHPEGSELSEPRLRIYVSLYDQDQERGVTLCNNVLKEIVTNISMRCKAEIEILKPCSVS
ncbi:MAG TPA: competence damage-inducible protein A [Ignisphaera aggregans]|uniref:Competence damage-inducible protein A n=1 Tax=Ignisphaera aggregans TaxID=334771 RepID=A0A833DUI3_9CREN|nr:competence damage-inducible protein A [Ignisphaera aggregans]